MATKKKPVDDPQSCASCRFFLRNQVDDAGYCRRTPPVVIVLMDEIYSEQPMTLENEWCGCYERRTH